MKKYSFSNSHGFTLVELLVVMAILGILVTIVGSTFRNSQARGRDAQRKSDLRQIASALELYYSDYDRYPDSSGGLIVGCSGNQCAWGIGEFTDSKTVYMRVMTKDPKSNLNYYYRVVDSQNQKYQLFAHLENTEDQDCMAGAGNEPDCLNPSGVPADANCGALMCNFAITSTNTTPVE
jgi:general secretion pathway protein G